MAIVTSISLVAGGPAVHVTVLDESGQPIPPANLTWQLDAGLTAAADATGFLFSAASTMSGSSQAAVAYNGPLSSQSVGAFLAISIIAPITALQFSSP